MGRKQSAWGSDLSPSDLEFTRCGWGSVAGLFPSGRHSELWRERGIRMEVLAINDCTDDVVKIGAMPTKPLVYREIDLILIHRSDVGEHGHAVASWYKRELGWGATYHFFVRKDGTIDQIAPLSIRVNGAWLANGHAVQIAVHGDFRKHEPTDAQHESLVALVAMILDWKPGLYVDGHSPAKPGRSKNPLKICPGKHLDPSKIAALARGRMLLDRDARVRESGLCV